MFKRKEAIGGRLRKQNSLQDAILGRLGHKAGMYLAWEVDLNGLDANVLGTRSHVESYGTGMRTWRVVSKGSEGEKGRIRKEAGKMFGGGL